jgi:hypothetical protein
MANQPAVNVSIPIEPLAILILAALVSWVLAELRGGRSARFATGFAAILAACFVGQFVAGVVPSYERSVTRASMRRLSELLGRGETDRVRGALESYNSSADQSGTYAAALKMWDSISPKPPESKLE